MRWWKIGLIGSAIWTLIVIAMSCGLAWYVMSHPMGEQADEFRARKVGEAAGFLLTLGLAGVWTYAYLRHGPASEPTTDSTPENDPDASPCPACLSTDCRKVTFTWWGGLVGPRLFHHTKCQDCGTTFNGQTGKSNTIPIAIYVAVSIVVTVGLLVMFAVWSGWWT